jgi:5-methylcytosine-specific restriction endonuclease McrA
MQTTEARKQTNAKYYAKNRSDFRRRNAEYTRKNREFLVTYKLDHGCARCGFNGHPAALEFHHLNPAEKSFRLSEANTGTYGMEKILEEIAKCEILCANCHRIVHASMG